MASSSLRQASNLEPHKHLAEKVRHSGDCRTLAERQRRLPLNCRVHICHQPVDARKPRVAIRELRQPVMRNDP